MAYGEFYVERQCWARFPKVLIMCRKHGRMENGNCAVERRRYVPERTCKLDANDVCSSCGACIQRVTHSVYEMGDGFACYPNYCPNCGARVVSE